MNYLVNLNLNKNEIQNAVIQPLAVAPSNPKEGQIYYNSADKFIYRYDGAKWGPIGVVYNQGNSTGAVITGLGGTGSVDTTNVVNLTLDGYVPVSEGYVSAGMTLEAAIKALDQAVKNAVAGGGEVNQNAFSNVNVEKQSTVVADVVGSDTAVNIGATAKTDTVNFESGNKWVQIKGDAATKTVTIGHKTSGVTAGQYGTNAKVPQVTVDETGHITKVVEQTITASSIGADPVGSASKVLGTDADPSTAATVYGAKKAASEAMTAAQNAQTTADGKVSSVGKGNNGIVIGGTTTAPTVGVALSKTSGNAATIAADGLMVTIPAGDSYSMIKASSPSTGAFATYHLTKNGANIGESIDIPKDYLVKDAQLKTSTGTSDPSGFPAGTEYIDFIINAKDGAGQESHIYLNVESLAVVYTAGNGIEISSDHKISAKVVAGNGLSVDATGIKMALAVADSAPGVADGKAGAMTGTEKAKLAGIEDGATNNLITINGQVDETPVFFAPVNGGTKGQVLVSNGNSAPTWQPAPETVHKYSASNGQLTAVGGAFEWKIGSTIHGIQNPAMFIQVYESTSGDIVITDVKVNPTNYEITITINDVDNVGTLAANTYRIVAIG